MRTLTSTILLCMVSTSVLGGYGGNIGITDDRQYGSQKDPLYSAIARLNVGNRAGGCTAGFIDKNLVITNHHCYEPCVQTSCSVTFWDGTQYQNSPIQPFMVPNQNQEERQNQVANGTDWAIFKTDIPNPNFKQVAPSTALGQVNRGGFGCLRIIEDSEISTLKSIYAEVRNQYSQKCKNQQQYFGCINQHVNSELKKRGIAPLFEDGANFKVQTCKISSYKQPANKMVQTDCDSAGGDSGAPLLRGNTIVALNNSGPQVVFQNNEYNGASALNTNNFYAAIQEAQQKVLSIPTTPNTPPPQPTPSNTKPTTATVTNQNEIQQILMNRLSDFQCD